MPTTAPPSPQTPSSSNSAGTHGFGSSTSHKRSASSARLDIEGAQPTRSSAKGKATLEKMARTVKGSSLEKRLKKRKSSLGKARAAPASWKLIRVTSEPVSGLLHKDDKGKEKECAIDIEDGSSSEEDARVAHSEAEVELECLRKKVKEQEILLESHRDFLDAVAPSLTCQICLEPMLRPYSLAPCGHSACYRCLNGWFRAPPTHIENPPPAHLLFNFDPENPSLLARNAPMLLRKVKACPVCRTVVKEPPIEAWGLKDIISHLFTHRGNVAKDLYPSYVEPTEPETVLGTAEVWKGIFRTSVANRGAPAGAANGAEGEPEGARGFFDEEDNVYRCTDCYHEIWGGACTSCGRAYPGIGHDEEDAEDDGSVWMDDHSFDDEVFDGGIIGRARHDDPADDDDVVDLDGIIGVLGQARRFIRDNGPGPRRPQQRQNAGDGHVPGNYESDEGEETEHEGDQGYESSFIDDDDVHPMEEYHSADEDEVDGHEADENQSMDEDEEDDGALSEDSQRRARRNNAPRIPEARFVRAGALYPDRPRNSRNDMPIVAITDDEEEAEVENAAAPRRRRNRLTVESDSDDGGISRVNRVNRIVDEEEEANERPQRNSRSRVARAFDGIRAWRNSFSRPRIISDDEGSMSMDSDAESMHSLDPTYFNAWNNYGLNEPRTSIYTNDESHDDGAWD